MLYLQDERKEVMFAFLAFKWEAKELETERKRHRETSPYLNKKYCSVPIKPRHNRENHNLDRLICSNCKLDTFTDTVGTQKILHVMEEGVANNSVSTLIRRTQVLSIFFMIVSFCSFLHQVMSPKFVSTSSHI